jgi:uncharacterized delta-60 repeat protein
MTARRGVAVLALVMSSLTAVLQAPPVNAGPGDLDPSFNAGRPLIDNSPPVGYAAVAIQGDGKIVAAGTGWTNDQMDIEVVRYTSAGVLDTSFGQRGRVLSDFGAYERVNTMALQPDGKIVVGGKTTPDWRNPTIGEGLVARYNADGTLDTGFGVGGEVVVEAASISALVVQPDGKLLVGGLTWGWGVDAKLVRLHPDGSVDRSFYNGRPGGMDPSGVSLPVGMYMAGADLLPDGRILIAGSTPYTDAEFGAVVVRLMDTGEVDETYGVAGVASVHMGAAGEAHDMAVQPDGKVVLAGVPSNTLQHARFIVARLTADGDPDLTFGTGGELLVPVGDAQNATATQLVLVDDGSLFVAGYASAGPGGEPYVPSRQFVAHIQRNGAIDPRFGTAGIASTVIVGGEPHAAIYGLAVQPDGRPIAVGNSMSAYLDRGFIFRLQPGFAGGPVIGCGWNPLGQLGEAIGTRPTPAAGLRARTDVDGVAAGAHHSLSLGADGTVWATGYNGAGQLGDGTTIDRTTPVLVAGLTDVVAVAAGAYHSLALKADGSVWAWGWNVYGALGDGTLVDHHLPVRVAGVSGSKIAAGAFHSMVLGSDGQIQAWGYNGKGQLGDGTTIDRHRPVAVVGLTGVVAVSSGLYHSLALVTDGSVRSWGWNEYGQLGDGTTVDRHRPVAVDGLAGVATLGAGSWFHTLAVRVDGSAWAWGYNNLGQLGDGTTVDRHTPVRVAGTAVFQSVSGGAFHSAGVDLAGTVRAWGWNGLGQLCDGTTVDHHRPMPVRTPAGAAVSVAAGAFHSLAG